MQRKGGVTLIELLIVVVIILILAAVTIPKLSAIREKAYFAAMRSDLKNLASQQQIYYADSDSYTTSTASLAFTNSDGVAVTIAATSSGWAATARHAKLLPAEVCSIYYGSAAAFATPATPIAPGEIACTRPAG